jgi:predicted permease
VSILALAPFFIEFSGMLRNQADPFSSLLLGLFVPFLIIALIYSVGVSAKRGG